MTSNTNKKRFFDLLILKAIAIIAAGGVWLPAFAKAANKPIPLLSCKCITVTASDDMPFEHCSVGSVTIDFNKFSEWDNTEFKSNASHYSWTTKIDGGTTISRTLDRGTLMYDYKNSYKPSSKYGFVENVRYQCEIVTPKI